jgi:hypothetical protein
MSEFIYNEDDSNHPLFKNTTVKTKKSLTETINETLQKPTIDIGLLSEVKITHEISE